MNPPSLSRRRHLIFVLTAALAAGLGPLRSAPTTADDGFIGIFAKAVPAEIAPELPPSVSGGVFVANTVPQSPAAAGGVKRGDVIVTFNGSRIADVAAYATLIRPALPGQKIELEIVRGGQVKSLTITVGTTPPAIVFMKSGEERLERSDFAGAVVDYTKAIRLLPNNAPAYLARGFAKARSGNLKGAITDYTRALSLDPSNPLAYLDRGAAKAARGDQRGAIADFSEALRLDPNCVPALTLRATAKDKLRDANGVAEDLATAAAIRARLAHEKQAKEFAAFQQEIDHAPLLKLLASSDRSVDQARERNRVLVAAKVQQLSGLLRESTTADLSALLVRIEQTMLDLSHNSEVDKDHAQQAAAANGTPSELDALRGLALCYRERIELLKPIAAAIREEIANRSR